MQFLPDKIKCAVTGEKKFTETTEWNEKERNKRKL